jgi:hypothetical protein
VFIWQKSKELLFRMDDILTFDVEDGIENRGSNFGQTSGSYLSGLQMADRNINN